jgi:hypothetical protein
MFRLHKNSFSTTNIVYRLIALINLSVCLLFGCKWLPKAAAEACLIYFSFISSHFGHNPKSIHKFFHYTKGRNRNRDRTQSKKKREVNENRNVLDTSFVR